MISIPRRYIIHWMDNELRLSVSKVKCFESCHKKFYYNYIVKLPKKEFEFYTFGKVVHKTLEDFHSAYLNGSTDKFNITMSKAYNVAKDLFKDKINPEMDKECFQILNQYLKIISTNSNHNLSSKVTSAEKDFKLALSDKVTLIGAIDRTQIDKDNILHISDYKTTKNKKYLVDDYFQLQTYAMVMMLEDPSLERVRVSYILLRHNFEYLTWEFTRDEIIPLKNKYLEYAEQIMKEDKYEASPSKLCRFCDFIEVCEDGRKATSHNFNGEVNW